VGEPSLEQLKEKVRKCLCRKEDIVLRRQRDNLLAAFCVADLKGAQAIRQRIEEEIKKHFMEGWDHPPVIKVGAATYPEEAISKRELFRKAKGRLRG
jgi:GGDEF domain-containing protein